jgi:hypothetical protein
MWNDELLEGAELDVLRPFLETEVRILDSLSAFVLACIRMESADVRCAPTVKHEENNRCQCSNSTPALPAALRRAPSRVARGSLARSAKSK